MPKLYCERKQDIFPSGSVDNLRTVAFLLKVLSDCLTLKPVHL